MFKKCLQFSLVLATVTIGVNTAHAILFQAPMTSSEDFQRYALQKNQQIYTQWAQGNIGRNDSEAHPQVLEFSQQALKGGSLKQALNDWNLLLRSIDLNKADREIFTLLAEKLQWQKELCRYILLEPELENILESPSLAKKCQSQGSSLPSFFSRQLNAGDLLVIDGKVFAKGLYPLKLVEGTYQWQIISNQQRDRRFAGTAEEFAKQKFPLQNWVSGDCRDYKFDHQDFNILLQSQIYFSETCVSPAIPPAKNFSTWSAEHKKLIWGLGILATAIMAAQLKDKTLVITRP